MLRCCDHLEQVIPQRLDVAQLQQAVPESPSPLYIVMLQEAQRLNNLLTCVKDMVQHLRKGVTGLSVMSEDLEGLQSSLLNGRVPKCWDFAFPSLKPLTSWATDVAERVEQISKWGLVSQISASIVQVSSSFFA